MAESRGKKIVAALGLTLESADIDPDGYPQVRLVWVDNKAEEVICRGDTLSFLSAWLVSAVGGRAVRQRVRELWMLPELWASRRIEVQYLINSQGEKWCFVLLCDDEKEGKDKSVSHIKSTGETFEQAEAAAWEEALLWLASKADA